VNMFGVLLFATHMLSLGSAQCEYHCLCVLLTYILYYECTVHVLPYHYCIVVIIKIFIKPFHEITLDTVECHAALEMWCQGVCNSKISCMSFSTFFSSKFKGFG